MVGLEKICHLPLIYLTIMTALGWLYKLSRTKTAVISDVRLCSPADRYQRFGKTSFRVWKYCSCWVLSAAQKSVHHVVSKIRSWTRPENEGHKKGAQEGTCEEHKRLYIRGTKGYTLGAHGDTQEGHTRVTRRGTKGLHTKSAAICINISFTFPLHRC